MRLAIIDIDGICADNSKCEAQAMLVAASGPKFWRAFLNAKLVSLDAPIAGAKEALLRLESDGYEVIFLSSSPEKLREATEKWLTEHDLAGSRRELILKPVKAQFVKTTVWKASEVRELVTQRQAQETLFIDDETANIEMAVALGLPGLVAKLNFD